MGFHKAWPEEFSMFPILLFSSNAMFLSNAIHGRVMSAMLPYVDINLAQSHYSFGYAAGIHPREVGKKVRNLRVAKTSRLLWSRWRSSQQNSGASLEAASQKVGDLLIGQAGRLTKPMPCLATGRKAPAKDEEQGQVSL
jgi:hypothetical protein